MRERERGEYKAVALLQAPHFCQQWHLYLLNALLMSRHICCCKLLLRPILDDEEKVTNTGARVPWFRPGTFLMEERKREISGTSLSWVCYSGSLFSRLLLPLLPPFFLYLLSSFTYLHFTHVPLFPTPPFLLPSVRLMYPFSPCPTCL